MIRNFFYLPVFLLLLMIFPTHEMSAQRGAPPKVFPNRESVNIFSQKFCLVIAYVQNCASQKEQEVYFYQKSKIDGRKDLHLVNRTKGRVTVYIWGQNNQWVGTIVNPDDDKLLITDFMGVIAVNTMESDGSFQVPRTLSVN